MGEFVKNESCPKCGSSSGLAVYKDNSCYCFSCGYTVASKYFSKEDNLGVLWVMDYIAEDILAKRKVAPEVTRRYGVKCVQLSDESVAIDFPICGINGTVQYHHYRQVNLQTGEMTREMKLEKGTKLVNPLFGAQLFTKHTRHIIICEGQTDALITASRIQKSDVLILGLVGSKSAKKAAAYIARFMKNVDITLCMDNDEAGAGAEEQFVAYLSEHAPETKLQLLPIPSEYNDIGDWLTDVDISEADLLDCIVPAFSSDLVNGAQMAANLGQFIKKLRDGSYIKLKFAPTLDHAVKLTEGSLVGVLGNGGEGKSTFVEHVISEAMAQKRHVLLISAEMRVEEVGLKFARMATGIDYYSQEVLDSISDEEINELETLTAAITKRLTMFARFGKCTVDEIQDKIYEMTGHGQAPSLVVIDHLLAVSSTGETAELEEIVKRLKAMAESNNCVVVVLSHTKKPPNTGNRLYIPTANDAYNSGALARYADFMFSVALDRDKLITHIMLSKWSRLGGRPAHVMMKLNDWQLVEILEDGKRTASSVGLDDEEEEIEEEDVI